MCGGAKSSEAPELVSRVFRDLAIVWVESPGEWPPRHGLGQAKRLGHVSFERYGDWSGVERNMQCTYISTVNIPAVVRTALPEIRS